MKDDTKDIIDFMHRMPGDVFDAADELEVDIFDASRNERQSAEDERAEILEAALDECKRLGLSTEHLRTLVLETGATCWGLRNSLLEPPVRNKAVWPID